MPPSVLFKYYRAIQTNINSNKNVKYMNLKNITLCVIIK